MSNFKGIKFTLPDKAKYRFNDARGNLKVMFSSDQLFSAIINCAALMYPRHIVSELIGQFKDGQIAISSMFYGMDLYLQKEPHVLEKSIYFLPKPYSTFYSDQVTNESVPLRKKAKDIAFLSTSVYQNLLKAWKVGEERFNYSLLQCQTIGGAFACTENEIVGLNTKERDKLHFITTQTFQKLQVNRFSNQSDQTYYQDALEISHVETSGFVIKPFMYFLYRGNLGTELWASLRLLVDEGIGGQRSRGYGSFLSVEEVEVPLEDNANGMYFLSLSSVFPELNDIDHVVSYQLAERSGFVYNQGGTSFRKQAVRMMTEGSIFSKRVFGQVKDVTPLIPNFTQGTRVYLNGKAFLLAFGGNGE